MIERTLLPTLLTVLAEAPAVCLVGPRQVGKTTLALEVARKLGGHYLDLESEVDRAKLSEGEAYLSRHLHQDVALDEVHRTPELSPVLRVRIDRLRQRAGQPDGTFCWALRRWWRSLPAKGSRWPRFRCCGYNGHYAPGGVRLGVFKWLF
ncbi:MAG: AAA family ATPase [Acidobacteriota bacterium]